MIQEQLRCGCEGIPLEPQVSLSVLLRGGGSTVPVALYPNINLVWPKATVHVQTVRVCLFSGSGVWVWSCHV